MTTTWEELVAASLVGTERRGVPPAAAGAVATLLGDDAEPALPPELQVLRLAGVLGAWRRAGWFPPHHAGGLPEPAPADERPLPSAAARQVLALLLGGQVDMPGGTGGLVGEWLERAAGAGRRIPDGLLSAVLDHATGQSWVRPAAKAAGGPRLRWLAAHNRAWRWAAGGAAAPAAASISPGEQWETGDRETRLALLSALREDDPDRVRELLAGTWAKEPAADRARFIEALATGLGPADEPFLEAALDDRSKAVRAEAAALLSALPSSQLSARMVERLRPLVRTGGRFRRKLEVERPDDPDAAGRRDGLPTDAPAGRGRGAWQLVHLVGAAPLDAWEDLTGLAPGDVVGLGAGDTDLVDGWVLAATRQRHTDWARLLLEVRPDPVLLGLLPAAAAEAAAQRFLARRTDQGLPDLLVAIPPPWSPAFSASVVDRLRKVKSPYLSYDVLTLLVTRLHPSAAPAVERWLDEQGDSLRDRARGLLHALSLRQTIAQELR